MYYIGLDVHKRKISYCVKGSGGKIYSEGSLSATRLDLDSWIKTLPQPWSAAQAALRGPVGHGRRSYSGPRTAENCEDCCFLESGPGRGGFIC
jgi:hypothetical protein